MMNDNNFSELLRPFRSLDGPLVVFDSETTDIIKDDIYPDIVTIGLIRINADRTVSDPVEFKVRPTKLMHPLAEKVHGISDAEASTFPTIQSQWSSIHSWLSNTTVIMHNADFDWSIMQDHIRRYGLSQPVNVSTFCSQKNATAWANATGVSGSWRGPSLDKLTKHFGIEDRRQSLGGIHGAANDAWQTAMVVVALRNLASPVTA